ncbi:MAG: saccharopine dehydrogenase NADP-binding domain-containing protein, partial [Bacteroidota bacterium]|nr:saccharopine dehydrogenase NADP-binding domain-containing protein [Bacteroidota bacterium]
MMMMLNKNIVLLGVTGFTGSLISELLLKNDINFIPAGRDLSQLKKIYKNSDITPAHVDIDSVESVNLLLQKTDILINCIGPYNLYGNEILKQIAEKNIIYIDISGEQEYIYNSFEKLDETAKQNKSTIIHSVSFESYIADMLADLVIEKDTQYKDISSFYYFANGRASSGTRLSMKLNKFFKSFALKNNELQVL